MRLKDRVQQLQEDSELSWSRMSDHKEKIKKLKKQVADLNYRLERAPRFKPGHLEDHMPTREVLSALIKELGLLYHRPEGVVTFTNTKKEDEKRHYSHDPVV